MVREGDGDAETHFDPLFLSPGCGGVSFSRSEQVLGDKSIEPGLREPGSKGNTDQSAMTK